MSCGSGSYKDRNALDVMFERYSHELMRRMAEASAADIEAELFGE